MSTTVAAILSSPGDDIVVGTVVGKHIKDNVVVNFQKQFTQKKSFNKMASN